jgi:hypothetical protein
MRTVAIIGILVGCGFHAGAVCAQAPASATGPGAATHPVVVELFTSQGCSSCPQADALLGRLADRDDIIALSLSVDYWDYLGWKDTLASPKFTERQRSYAKARGDGAIYTPQAVINGIAHVNGSDANSIRRAVEKTAHAHSAVPVKLSEHNGKLIIEAGQVSGAVATNEEATIWLAVMASRIEVQIQRGENRGRTVAYHNVVRELIPVGTWSGQPIKVQLERHTFMSAGAHRCAVLLQKGHAGPIIGAALMREF